MCCLERGGPDENEKCEGMKGMTLRKRVLPGEILGGRLGLKKDAVKKRR